MGPGGGVGSGGTGGSGPPMALWMIVSFTPPINKSPVRSAPRLVPISSVTDPSPLPVAAESIEIHEAWLAAVQAQPAGAPTATTSRPPLAPATRCVGLTVTIHAARCVNSMRCSLTRIVPLRSTGSGLPAML